MLSYAKLQKKSWAKALSTALAVYLCNCSPTRAVLGKTPFEALTKEKPIVGYLRIFVVYVMHMSLKMTEENLMLRPEGTLCWDMALKPKHIGFITLKRRKYFSVEI